MVDLSQGVVSVEVLISSISLFENSQPRSGLGHGISNCPKLEDAKRRELASHRGADDGGGY
jgi:hypothetical protein